MFLLYILIPKIHQIPSVKINTTSLKVIEQINRFFNFDIEIKSSLADSWTSNSPLSNSNLPAAYSPPRVSSLPCLRREKPISAHKNHF